MTAKIPLVVLHDGAVDEFASIALLMGHDFQNTFDLQGVIVVNGDCYGAPAVWVTQRILAMGGMTDVKVGLSNTRAVNGFPWAYRQYPLVLNTMPALKEIPGLEDNPPIDGDELLASIVKRADQDSLVVLTLSGLTPLAHCMQRDPSWWNKIKSLYWMGGVIGAHVPGNISPDLVPNAPMHSEWNVFYDPFAAKAVYENLHPAQIYQFPLNVTNAYPNEASWIRDKMNPLAKKHPVIDFLANAYSVVVPQGGACLWDVVTTIGLLNEIKDLDKDRAFFDYTDTKLWIETSYGPEQGRVKDAGDKSGRTVKIASAAKGKTAAMVRKYALDQWSSIQSD